MKAILVCGIITCYIDKALAQHGNRPLLAGAEKGESEGLVYESRTEERRILVF